MKRSEHLELLSHDLYAGLQVARRLRSGLQHQADIAEMGAFVVHFWNTYLAEHFRQEEELLFVPLHEVGGATLAERMATEHRSLERLVTAFREEAADADTAAAFADELQKHIRFEEREVFPFLEGRVRPTVLEDIGRRLHRDYVTPDLSWPVAFWDARPG